MGSALRTEEQQRRHELALRGLSLKEMGKELDVSGSAMEYFLVKYGDREFWRGLRRQKIEEERKQRGSERRGRATNMQQLSALLRNRAAEQARKDGWEYEMAMKYKERKPNSFDDIESLAGLFREYKRAEESSEEPSLEELENRTDFNASHLSDIFRTVEIVPFHGNKPRSPLSKEQSYAISRAYDSIREESTHDIAYFLRLPEYIVQNRFSRMGGKPFSRPVRRINGRYLSLRMASEIYEAVDLGFNQRKTAQLLDVGREIVEYAIENRDGISGRILRIMNVLYPERNSDKPYL